MDRNFNDKEIEKILYEFELAFISFGSPKEFFADFLREKEDYAKLQEKNIFFKEMCLLVDELEKVWCAYHEKTLCLGKEHDSFEKKRSILNEAFNKTKVADLDYISVLEKYSLVANAQAEYFFSNENKEKIRLNQLETEEHWKECQKQVRRIRKDVAVRYDILSKDDSMNLLDKIETMLNDIQMVYSDGIYRIGKEYIDLNSIQEGLEHISDYFQGILDEINQFEYVRIDELEYLDQLYVDLEYLRLLALIIRWLITYSENDLNLIFKLLMDSSLGGLQRNFENISLYANRYESVMASKIDDELKKWIIYVNQYIEARKEYISVYLAEKEIDDSVKRSTLEKIKNLPCWEKCDKEDKSSESCQSECQKIFSEYRSRSKLLRNAMSVHDFCHENDVYKEDDVKYPINHFEVPEYCLDYLDSRITEYLKNHPGRVTEDIKESEQFYTEYFEFTRNLSEEEKLDTGKYAFELLFSKVELLNLMKILLREASEKESQYEAAYNLIADTVDTIVATEYQYPHVFYDRADSEALFSSTEKYKLMKNMELLFKFSTSIANNDIEALMNCRKEFRPLYLTDCPWLIEKFDECIEQVVEKIRCITGQQSETNMENTGFGLDDEYSNGMELSEHMKKTLSTAEFLFKTYIDGEEERSDMDYSFISIMYYQSLEIALNELLFSKYTSTIPNEIDISTAVDFFGKNKGDQKNVKYYMTGNGYGDSRKYSCKNSIELGNLGHFLLLVNKNDTLCKFVTTKYKRADKEKLTELGNKILLIKDRRNDAAHGVYVNFDTSKEDKFIIYSKDSSYDTSVHVRNLLIELFSALI